MIMIVILVASLLIHPAFLSLSRAITEEHNLRLKLENMAYQDPMTELLSRDGLDSEIEQLNPDEVYAYAIIDLNMFKSINDTFGHSAGDSVLIELGKRLNKVCAEPLKVARIGGDEFAVLDPSAKTQEDCAELGGKLVEIFNQTFDFKNIDYTLGASVGIALSSDVNGDFYDVAKAADAAMYSLKGESKTGYDIFSSKYHASSSDLSRKFEITQAIKQNSIRPVFQPKVNMLTNEIVGFEALARWHSPNGVFNPDNFIADINQFGQQYNFTLSMLDKVLIKLSDWSEKGFSYPISINVSPDVLVLKDIVQKIRMKLNEYSDVKHLITIEITEDVFSPRLANAIRKSVYQLISEGVSISIDDFGSGYASYRHLNEFNFHELKVDKSFIDGVGKDGSAEVILQSISSIAQGLNVELVAEGVETQEQVDFLISENFKIAQGFFYFKPMTSQEIISNFLTTPNEKTVQTGKVVVS